MRKTVYTCDWCGGDISHIKDVVIIRRSSGCFGCGEFGYYVEREICKKCDDKISGIEYAERINQKLQIKENL